MENIRKFGWIPDLPDHRDLVFKATKTRVSLPESYDLRKVKIMPKILDQGEVGSCTANAAASAYLFCKLNSANSTNAVDVSRSFIYYWERILEGTYPSDSGAQIRTAIKVLARYGSCAERLFPYSESTYNRKPTSRLIKDALTRQILKYERLPRSLSSFKKCIYLGNPFLFGFTVYSNIDNIKDNDNILSLPSLSDSLEGGHAVLAVGYDNTKNCFIVMNSWGSDWGDNGYFYLPYEYLTNSNLSDDFWTISDVE